MNGFNFATVLHHISLFIFVYFQILRQNTNITFYSSSIVAILKYTVTYDIGALSGGVLSFGFISECATSALNISVIFMRFLFIIHEKVS